MISRMHPLRSTRHLYTVFYRGLNTTKEIHSKAEYTEEIGIKKKKKKLQNTMDKIEDKFKNSSKGSL